jgi:glutamine amidotransferase
VCRILVLVGEIQGETLKLLTRALADSARRDPYNNNDSHGDGWGYLEISLEGNVGKTVRYRSLRPIYEEEEVLRGIKPGRKILMFHARKKSPGTPLNIHSTHPVMATTRLGYELYMIHNGEFTLDPFMQEISQLLGNPRLLQEFNDTYLANLWLASKTLDEIDQSHLATLQSTAKMANIALALLAPQETTLIVSTKYPSQKKDYAKLYHCTAQNLHVYASSTLIDYYIPANLLNCTVLDNLTAHKYTAKNNEITGPMQLRLQA